MSSGHYPETGRALRCGLRSSQALHKNNNSNNSNSNNNNCRLTISSFGLNLAI